MLNDCTCFGLPFEDRESVAAFVGKYRDRADIREHEEGSYATLQVDDGITLYFYGDKNGVDPLAMEPFYMPGHPLDVSEARWIRYPEKKVDSALLSVHPVGGDADFPLNVEIPDACFMDNEINPLKAGGRTKLALILFAESLEVYENAQTYEEGGEERSTGAECVIPVGTFPLAENQEEFEPDAQVLINGIVQDVRVKKNPLTGLPYWNYIISCLGYRLEAVAPLGEVTDLLPGNVVEGLYRAAGRIVRE